MSKTPGTQDDVLGAIVAERSAGGGRWRRWRVVGGAVLAALIALLLIAPGGEATQLPRSTRWWPQSASWWGASGS